METIFHSLQVAPAFFRTRMAVQEKAIKICQSHFQQMQFPKPKKHTKKAKKYKKISAASEVRTVVLETTILDWPALGSSHLRVLTGSLH